MMDVALPRAIAFVVFSRWARQQLWIEEGISFNGFLSYSHSDDADRFSLEVQKVLQHLARPFFALRALRIFRDFDQLRVSEALWPALKIHLERSNYFILLASPAAAGSRGVAYEVEAGGAQ